MTDRHRFAISKSWEGCADQNDDGLFGKGSQGSSQQTFSACYLNCVDLAVVLSITFEEASLHLRE